jgi:hypothetical protein
MSTGAESIPGNLAGHMTGNFLTLVSSCSLLAASVVLVADWLNQKAHALIPVRIRRSVSDGRHAS